MALLMAVEAGRVRRQLLSGLGELLEEVGEILEGDRRPGYGKNITDSS